MSASLEQSHASLRWHIAHLQPLQVNALGLLSLMETHLVRNTRTQPDSICSECRYRVPAVISDRMRVDNEGNRRRENSCIHQLLRAQPIRVLPSVLLWSTSYHQVGSCQTVLHFNKSVGFKSTNVFYLTNHWLTNWHSCQTAASLSLFYILLNTCLSIPILVKFQDSGYKSRSCSKS